MQASEREECEYGRSCAYDLLDEVLVLCRAAAADADQRLRGPRYGGLVLGVDPRQDRDTPLAPESANLSRPSERELSVSDRSRSSCFVHNGVRVRARAVVRVRWCACVCGGACAVVRVRVRVRVVTVEGRSPCATSCR
jgi:hypothetical protein